jgi:mannose-1-phosphate guanylyltransferase / mannose-6-phosphate isomerase
MTAVELPRSTPTQTLAHEAKDWLFQYALPLWYDRGTDFSNWGFSERLDEMGQPIDEPRRINVQARQVYVFALAGKMGWAARDTKRAIEHGLEAIERYRRRDGLYAFKLNTDGSYFAEAPEVYGQAFVLLAWAHAGVALDRQSELEAKALTLVQLLREQLSHAKGGFNENTVGTLPLRSNPHMHLFEAAQAWMAISDAPQWAELAREIAHLAVTKFIDAKTGWLRELFDADWQAIPDAHGILAEPGHQFEWAWLLNRYGHAVGNEACDVAARKLYSLGISGIDPTRHVPFMEWSVGKGARSGQTRLWPTTEWLKAALSFGDEEQVVAAYAGLGSFLDKPRKGLWADKMKVDGSLVIEPAPTSTFYHIICAIDELLYTAAQAGETSPRKANSDYRA